MRRLGRPVAVTTDAQGCPRGFELDRREREVRQVTEQWVEVGRWWELEQRKRFYRVEADGLVDLSLDEQGVWRLEVVWD